MLDYADVRFVESKGAALEPVQRALYSNTRPAKNRFHWMFPPDKDERVESLLSWIQSVSYGLATFGVSTHFNDIGQMTDIVLSIHAPPVAQILTNPGTWSPYCECGLQTG